MKWVRNIATVLIFLSGIGHLVLGSVYWNEKHLLQMLLAGIIYLCLSVLTFRKNKYGLPVSAAIMLMATIGALATIKMRIYPMTVMICFIGLNSAVVILTAFYFLKVKFVRELSK